MDYPTYLALDELLSLQRAQSKPEQPDELLFIVVHQASELWFKVILREEWRDSSRASRRAT